jgi:hypothetical protein
MGNVVLEYVARVVVITLLGDEVESMVPTPSGNVVSHSDLGY